MRTATDRLKFAVQFAEMRLDHLRAGDWANLRDDFRVLFGGTGEPTPMREFGLLTMPDDQETFSDGQFLELQKETRAMLSALSDPSPSLPAPRGEAKTNSLSAVAQWVYPVHLQGTWAIARTPRGPFVAVRSSFRDAFLMKLASLLTQEGNANIKRCPECKKLFWRVRRQLYCSRTCTNRRNMRDWSREQRKTTAHKAKKGGSK